MPDYNLFGLSTRSFEQLIQALSVKIIGPHIVIFGDGPDGGREATFKGEIQYPDSNNGWNGYGVIQAKFKQKKPEDTEKDGKWALKELEKELNKFTDEKRDLVKPEYYIFATNVVLSAVYEKGAKDKITKLVDSYKSKLPLKDFAIWDNDQIRTFLDNNADVRKTYAAWITPGDILAKLLEEVEINTPDFQSTIENYLEKELLSDHYVNLGQAGHATDRCTALGRVFIDLPVSTEHSINPLEEEESETYPKGFANEAVIIGDQNLRVSMNKDQRVRKSRQQTGRYVLIGGPGQGKTTIGQFICQLYRASLLKNSNVHLSPEAQDVINEINEQCEKDDIRLPQCKRFPIRIVLNEYASFLASKDTNRPKTVLSFILKKIEEKANSEISYNDFKNWLRSYPWLLIFDGLDEVPASSNREELLQTVSDFLVDVSHLDSDILIIATSRPQGYDKNRDFSSKYYHHLYLTPLSDKRALFYGNRLAEIRYGNDMDRKNKVIARLERATNQPDTARLMRSPLQVTIMATLVDQIGQPPHERWRLFKEYYEVIGRREKERDIPAAEIIRDYRPDIDALHNRVGLQLQVESEQEENTEARLSPERFQEIIKKRLNEEGHENRALENLLKKIIEAATERLVFLVGLESEKIGFEIRSLQEFMAAECLVDKSDEIVRKRLRAIASASHWRNVFLFACGKCFVERQHLRDTILTICDEMNEEDETGVFKTVLAGSVLALDLIEDGPARKQPKYSNALIRKALRLLDIKTTKYAFRLGEVYEPAFETVYQEELKKRIQNKNVHESYSSWLLLLFLAKKNESWALELADKYWFTDQTMRVDFFSRLLEEKEVEQIWPEFLTDELKLCLSETSVTELGQIITSTGPYWRKNKFIDEILLSMGNFSWIFQRLEHIGIKFSLFKEEKTPLNIEIIPLNIKRNIELKNFSDYQKKPFHNFLLQAGLFWKNPSKELLALVIQAFPVEETKNAGYYDRFLPWPITSCMKYCTTEIERNRLVERMEKGDLGDIKDWVKAEKRWRNTGVLEQDLIYCDGLNIPFDKKISQIGYPLLFSNNSITVNHNALKFINKLKELCNITINKDSKKDILRLYLFSVSRCRKADRNHYLTEGIEQMLLSDEYNVSHFWHDIYKFFSEGLTIEDELFLNKFGMRERLNVLLAFRKEHTSVIRSIETSFNKTPNYQGLLRILTEYVITGAKTTRLNYKNFNSYNDPIDQGNILLLRLASNQLDNMSPQQFVSEILSINKDKNELPERLVRLIINHDMSGEWIEKVLAGLDNSLPSSCWEISRNIQEYLQSLYLKHTSPLSKLETRNDLKLPLISLKI
jgi:hypothetical protein